MPTWGSSAWGESAYGAEGGLPSLVVLTDELAIGCDMSAVQTALLRARVAVESGQSLSFDGSTTLRDTLGFEDRLALLFHELLADSLAMGGEQVVTYAAIARLVDALLLSGTVATYTEASAMIVDALTFGVVGHAVPISTLTAEIGLDAQVTLTYHAIARLVDALALEASMTATATLSVLMSDELALSLAGSTALEALTVLRDQMDCVLQLNIDDEQYIAWTMSTAGKAASSYTNFPFNSFMQIGGAKGQWYGIADTGLYRMGGDDDAGTPIDAKLRLGMSSLGTRLQKRMASMYLGYKANGDLLVKAVVASTEDGAREAHVYRLYVQAAGSLREGRVPIGKGLKAPYWDFVIENVDGADFELDVIEFLPLYTERRIRGNAGGKP